MFMMKVGESGSIKMLYEKWYPMARYCDRCRTSAKKLEIRVHIDGSLMYLF
jgi:hypothetical protein